jgi:HEAT repeat protein
VIVASSFLPTRTLNRTLDRRTFFLWMACCVAIVTGCHQDSPPPDPRTATRILTALLDDRDGWIRQTAADALGKIGEPGAEPFLIHALRDPEPAVRAAAARGLGRLSSASQEAGTALLSALGDPDLSVRRAAAQALGAIEGLAALAPALAALLTNSDPAVREAAAHALSLMEAREIWEALAASATDPHPAVRQWVVAALGEADGAGSLDVLADRVRRDEAPQVRGEAAYRLGFIGNESVLADLEQVALRDANVDVRRWARRSFEELRKESGSDSTRRPGPPAELAPFGRSP